MRASLFSSVSDTESRYLRVTSLLSANSSLAVGDSARIRRVSIGEAEGLAEEIRKRHLYSRHSWEQPFYVERAKELANRTVIELVLPGQPNEIVTDAQNAASVLEQIALLSTSLSMSKKDVLTRLRHLEDTQRRFYLILGPKLQYLRSRSKRNTKKTGCDVDKTFVNRFHRCGFGKLYNVCCGMKSSAQGVRGAIEWLFQSRVDQNAEAAVVKSAIALETLLVFDKSEPLKRCLSERMAFLLSDHHSVRERVAKCIKDFYDVRSSVVHGSKRSIGVSRILEAADRLGLLACLVVAANVDGGFGGESLRQWLESERWRAPRALRVPYSGSYLSRALKLVE